MHYTSFKNTFFPLRITYEVALSRSCYIEKGHIKKIRLDSLLASLSLYGGHANPGLTHKTGLPLALRFHGFYGIKIELLYSRFSVLAVSIGILLGIKGVVV